MKKLTAAPAPVEPGFDTIIGLIQAAQERWSKRELERQFKAALFERVVTAPAKVSPVVRQSHPQPLSVFKDAYMLEFLNLPASHGEADLHRGLIESLKTFLIELGRFEPEHLGKLNFYLEALDRDACAHAFNPPCGAGASGNIRSNNTPQASPTAPGRDAQTGGFILSGVANAV